MNLIPSVSAVALAAALLFPTALPAATADSSVTWSVVPADAEGPDGRVSARHAVDPGATVSDFVTVTNLGQAPASFDVYASDGIVGADGLFDLLPAATAPVDGGAWVSVGEERAQRLTIDVAPGGSVTVPYAIDVPRTATPGDHPAGVVASLTTANEGVSVDSRVGVRVHLRVNGEIAPELSVEDVEATWIPSWNPFEPGTVRLTYGIENSGNVRLGASSEATIGGPFGWGAASASGTHAREILPSQATTGVVELSAWPLALTTGDVSVTPEIVGDDDVAAEMQRVPASFQVWTIPWSQLALLAIIAAIVVGGVWLRRRSRARTQARIDAAVAAARAVDVTI